MSIRVVPELFEKYVKGTEKRAIVQNVQVLLCRLTAAVTKGVSLPCDRVYINTRVLKHVYDKRTAEEFDFLLENLHKVVKYPNLVFQNKSGKRGAYCFVKEIKNQKYLCSIEISEKEDESLICEVVTFFRTNDDYLDNHELLWEWKDGAPSS